jgi:hypothetical protein
MQRPNEIDLERALAMLEDVSAETLCRMAEAGRLKSRRVGESVYFVLDEIEGLSRAQADEARGAEAS